MKGLVFFLLMLAAGPLFPGVISREEALKAAFPGAEIRQSMVFLTEAQAREAARIAGASVPTELVARFEAIRDGKSIGRAYQDTHIVRTKKESLLIELDSSGKLIRVEVVAFLEPPEYMPPDRWYKQFDGKALTEDLQMNGAIHPVAGATLSARATTEAVRRELAIDQVLQKGAAQP
jgi:hypothetical protein